MQVREHAQVILRVSNFCFLPSEWLRNTSPLVTFSPVWLPDMFLRANCTWFELPGVFWVGPGCSSREKVVIHCCAGGSQITPLSSFVSGGPAFPLERICLHPTQIFWHLISTTLNYSCDKHKTKVSGNVTYVNPLLFRFIPEVLYLASISNDYCIHFKKAHEEEVKSCHNVVGDTQHSPAPHLRTQAIFFLKETRPTALSKGS